MSESLNPYVRFGVAAGIAFGSLALEGCTENVGELAHEQVPVESSEPTSVSTEPPVFINPSEIRYPISDEVTCEIADTLSGCINVPVTDNLVLMVPETIVGDVDRIKDAAADAESHMIASSNVNVTIEVVTIPDIDPVAFGEAKGKMCIDGILAARAATKTLDQDLIFSGIVTDMPLCPSSLPVGADGLASIWDGERYMAINGGILHRTGDETIDSSRFSDVLWHEIKHLYGLGHVRTTECDDNDAEPAVTAIRFEDCISDSALVREYGNDPLLSKLKGGYKEGMYMPGEPELKPIQIEALMENSADIKSHEITTNKPIILTSEQMQGNDVVTLQLPNRHTYRTDMGFDHSVVQVKFIAVDFTYPEISGFKIIPYFYDTENGMLTLPLNNIPLLIRESDAVAVSIGDNTVTAKLLTDGRVSFTAN